MQPYLKTLKRYVLHLAAKFAKGMLSHDGFRMWNPPTYERKKP